MPLVDRTPGGRLRHAVQKLQAGIAPIEVLGLPFNFLLQVSVKTAELVDHVVEARPEPAYFIGRRNDGTN